MDTASRRRVCKAPGRASVMPGLEIRLGLSTRIATMWPRTDSSVSLSLWFFVTKIWMWGRVVLSTKTGPENAVQIRKLCKQEVRSAPGKELPKSEIFSLSLF